MATPTGGQYIFTAAAPINLVLTPDGAGVPAATNNFDLEIFTASPTTTAAGYEGSAVLIGGSVDTNSFVVGPSTSALQLREGNFLVSDVGGSDTIIAGSGNQTIGGGTATTIIGGTGILNVLAGSQNVIELGTAAKATVNALGAQNQVTLGDNNATVFAGTGTTVDAGAGKGTVIFHLGPDTLSSGDLEVMTVSGTGGGTFTIVSKAQTTIGSMTGTADSLNIIGVKNDTINLGGVNSATVNALNGNEEINLGTGGATVFGTDSDTINAGAGQGVILFHLGKGGGAQDLETLTVSGASNKTFTISSAADTVTGSLVVSANTLNLNGVAGDTIQLGGVATATVNALAGNESVVGGSGDATVFAGNGDTVSGGAGSAVVLFHLGDSVTSADLDVVTISGASNKTFTISATNPADSTTGIFVGSGANVNIAGVTKDTISLGGTANATVNALNKSELILLGSGSATVFAETKTTIIGGNGGTGTVLVNFGNGDKETATLTGASGGNKATFTIVGGTGDSVFFGSTAASINGAAKDTILGGKGDQLVNALAGKEFISLSEGNDTVFGSDNDTIGVAAASGTTTVTGTQFWLASSVGGGTGAVGFGTFNDSLAVGRSQVAVTVGTVSGGVASEAFDTTTDFLFYEGANAATSLLVAATAAAVDISGVASTQITFLDGTVMTLVGVDPASINVGLFRDPTP